MLKKCLKAYTKLAWSMYLLVMFCRPMCRKIGSIGSVFLVIVCVGCGNSNSPKPALPRNSDLASPPQLPADDANVVARLEGAQAKLKRDAQQRVVEVDLRGHVVKDEEISGLSKLASLQVLSMDSVELTQAGWSEIGLVKSLRQLDIRECALSNEDLALCIGNLPDLRALRMASKSGATSVDDTGLVSVAKCKELRVLALDYLWVSAEGLGKLTELQSLSELYLANTIIDDSSVAVLLKFPQLKKLRLARTQIGDEGLVQLAKLKSIEDLDLSECSQITDAGMAALGQMQSLKRLNLWRDAISDDGVKHFRGLTNMEWLNVDNTQLSDLGLEAFQAMSKLTFLHLGSTGVSDAGMPKLKPLKSLKDLKVTRTSVTEKGVEELLKDLPSTSIQLKYTESE